jgi:hypothetical protein
MTAATPVDKVVQFLETAGYRRLTMPLQIAGLDFAHSAAFVGTNPSPDLILVEDSTVETAQRILRRVEGVARALDVVRSKRPVTAVIAGPRPSAAVLDAMTKVCRVLPVGTVVDDNQETALRNWLAVLLPLTLPTPSRETADPLNEITDHIDGLAPEIAGLIDTATSGADAVQARLHEIIARSLVRPSVDNE